MNKYFEKELPQGYKEVCHIDAKDKKIGLIFNAIAFGVLIVVMILAFIGLNITEQEITQEIGSDYFVGFGLFMLAMILYIILHELIHGIAYKVLTKEKLTFGLSWSCAFCGVPNIYTYRKTALIALLAPFITFTIILLPLTIIMLFVNPVIYLGCAFIFGLHFGGCSGDLYMTHLLVSKYKNQDTLIKDTGPEQFIYIKAKKSNEE